MPALSPTQPGLSLCRGKAFGGVKLTTHLHPMHGTIRKHVKIRIYTIKIFEERGSVVVKALCYKPEGRGFETR
jgi:hypothetical protein